MREDRFKLAVRHWLLSAALWLIAPIAIAVEALDVSPDTTIGLGGTNVNDEQVATDDLLGGAAALRNLGSLPAAADVTAYHLENSGDQLFAVETATILGTVTALSRDVVRFDGANYSRAFDGAGNGIPDGARIDGLSATLDGRLLLSFDVTIDFGTFRADDEDVVMWDGVGFTAFFDGSDAGVDEALDVDALHYREDQDAVLVSFDTTGSIDGLTFHDEDVLVHDIASSTWTRVYEGLAEHDDWGQADLDAMFANLADADGDGIGDDIDNCVDDPNTDQANNDGDPLGDICDDDDDNDGISDDDEINIYGTNPFLADTDGDGISDLDEINSGTDPLDPNQAPVAVIAPPANVSTDEVTTLDGSGSFDPDGIAITSYEWTLLSVAAGSARTTADIVGADQPLADFTPDVAGDYQFALTVSDGARSNTAQAVLSAFDNEVPPTADAGDDQAVSVLVTVTLDGSASVEADGTTDDLGYLWTFAALPSASALSDVSISDSTTAAPSFVPDVTGDYLLTLTVTDPKGSDSDQVKITAEDLNVPPNADAGPDQLAVIGIPVALDASGSNDPDTWPQPLTFLWRFVSVPPGSSLTDADIVNAGAALASFIPDALGMYTLRVDVSDGEAGDFDQMVVTAGDLPGAPQDLFARAKVLKLNLVWTAASNADTYAVFRRLSGESAFTELGTTTGLVFFDVLPTGTSYADYYVVARNAFGEGPPSGTVRATPTTTRQRR